MSDLARERALRPIYSHLDAYSYSKALKLTYSKPQCEWPITVALRAHCLERSGRKLDACREIRILVTALSKNDVMNETNGSGSSGSDWSELDETIWMLGLGREGEKSLVGASAEPTKKTSTSTSTSASSSNTGSSSRGKGKKGKGKSSTSNKSNTSATTVAASGNNTASAKANVKSPLDMIHVLDFPNYKLQQILSSSKFVEQSFAIGTNTFQPSDIVDETVLATISVTLHSLRLYHTIANLYSKSIAVLTPKNKKFNQLQREELCTILIQGYQSQLKWIATQKHNSSNSTTTSTTTTSTTTTCKKKTNDELHSARCVLFAWEEAQFIAMSLVKYSGNCTLYKSWCAFATIQHWKSCNILLNLLLQHHTTTIPSNNKEEEEEEKEKEKKKLQQKVTMLPRLAEMLIRGVCAVGQNNDKDQANDTFPPSADDWRIFKECLDSQQKFSDMADILQTVRCGSEKEGRQIDDEDDVRHHLGSLIQLSERERIEIMAEMNAKLGNFDVATNLYSEKLLEMLPDQWSYWDSFMKYSFKRHNLSYDAAFEECNNHLERVLENQDRLRQEGKAASRVPLRGPHLFRLHLTAEGIRTCDTNDIPALCKAIEEYGNIFSSQVSCCFQDLRPYIELMVQKSLISCQDEADGNKNDISDEVDQLMNWAKSIRETNNLFIQLKEENVEDDNGNEKRKRKSKLRAYIFSVKIMLELWYQSLSKVENDDTNRRSTVGEIFMKHIPSVDELVQLWENVLDLGSNPNDGGQKETLPGDDLILLASQLLIHQSHQKSTKQKTSLYFLAATLLEKAIRESPYNPYLKISAINIYVENNVTTRAWELFQELKVAHIQLDSCSYIIFRHLLHGGLYNEAIGQAGQIINLHSTSAKDVSKFMPKAFENGNLMKGFEMISWQRYEMNHSIQLLEAKRLVMDLAPLYSYTAETNSKAASSSIGVHHGICGVMNTDTTRAEKIVRDSSNIYAAPSLIALSNYDEDNDNNDVKEHTKDDSWSDNRDFTVNEFEILERTNHEMSSLQSVTSSHVHAILTRIVLLLDATKAPRKGKVVKYSPGDDLDIRVKSVLQTIANAETFLNKSSHLSDVHRALWKAKLLLCQSICMLSAGIGSIEDVNGDSKPVSDTIGIRETKCAEMLNKATEKMKEAMEAWKSTMKDIEDSNESNKIKFICGLLPESLLPTYVVVRTTANLFGLFNWGKRKRKTKVAVGALADTALLLRDISKAISAEFVKDLPQSREDGLFQNDMTSLTSDVIDLISITLPQSKSCILSEENKGVLDEVVENKAAHRLSLRQRLEPFFNDMINELDTFDMTD